MSGGEAVESAAVRVRRVAALATLVMLVLTRPLWTGSGDELPRVPFLSGVPQTSGASAWVVFAATSATVAGTAAARRWRPWYWASAGLITLLVAQDQHRFQPWLYQYVMTGLFLAAVPDGGGLRYARWWFVALYLHSGLSKLDWSFCHELGPVFLRESLGPLGVEPGRWRPPSRTAAVLAMPALEVALAWALVSTTARTLGRAGAVLLHLVLIGILGPLGLGHSAAVLVWNAAMLVEVWFAFGVDLQGAPARNWQAWPVRIVFWVGALLPFGERWGVWDAWPSHALYASHVGRVDLLIHEDDMDGLPVGVRGHLKPFGNGSWRRLDLTGWSRTVRGTPVYPQPRACLGLVKGVLGRYGGPLRVPARVVLVGPGERWTGSRVRRQADGPEDIGSMGDAYWWNVRPWWPGQARRTPR